MTHLREAMAQVATAPQALKDQAITNRRQAAKVLAAREKHQAVIELLTLDPSPSADEHEQLATAYEKRAQSEHNPTRARELRLASVSAN